MKDKRIITIISAVVLVIATAGLFFLNGNKKEEVKVNADAKKFAKEYETVTKDNPLVYKKVD